VNDAHLRDLERRFLETRSLADEVAWLGARVQAGQVQSNRVELAAALGDPAARELSAAPPDMGLGEFLLLVAEVDRLAFARTGLALLRPERLPAQSWKRALYRAVDLVYQFGEIRLEGAPLEAVEAVEAWALCPCAECGGEALRTGEAALREANALEARWDGWGAPDSLPEINRLHAEIYSARSCGQLAVSVGSGWAKGFVELVDSHAAVTQFSQVRAELVPWLLGIGDVLATQAALKEASPGSASVEVIERDQDADLRLQLPRLEGLG